MNIETIQIDIAKLELRPGDMIVLRYDMMLTFEQREAIIRAVEQYIPDHQVMVFDGGATVEILRPAT